MSSASAPISPTTIVPSEQALGPSPNGAVDASPHSAGGESPTSSGAASSGEEEDDHDDEDGEVDENGAIVIEDDDDEDDGEDTPDDEQGPHITVKHEPSPPPNSIALPALLNKPPSSKPADKAESPLPPPTSTAAKPKSKAKVKARSPSPLPIAAPPLQTIRLSIKLGGPDNYAVDISGLAKATGQRPPTPVQKRNDENSDSEAERVAKEIEARTDADKPKKKKVYNYLFHWTYVNRFLRRKRMLLRNTTTFQIPSSMIPNLLLMTASSLPRRNSRASMSRLERSR